MDHRNLGGREPSQEVAITIFVHEKTNRAAMHAVDRLAGIHEPLQGRQHEAVAAERDYDVRGLGPDVAVALDQAPPSPLRRGHIAGHEGDALITGCRAFFRHGRAVSNSGGDRRGRSTMDKNNERVVFVYTTHPSIVEAERISRELVQRRLCACVNILPGMVSLYWWQGSIERGEEVVMIIKTRAALAEQVGAAVRQMHSYTTPAILVLPIESVDQSYKAWLLAETEGAAA
jgi:periplasmic divalent cation tolerance protein